MKSGLAYEKAEENLRQAIAYARWAGCSKCVIDVQDARFLLELLLKIKESNNDQT